jgi:hypothetical protein
VANEFVGHGRKEKSKPRPFKSERVGHPEKLNQFLGVDVLEWYYPTVRIRQVKNAKGWATVGAIQNQAVIFHEALHGFTGLFDSNPFTGSVTLESALGISYNPVSSVITDYLRVNVLGGGSTDTCGN